MISVLISQNQMKITINALQDSVSNQGFHTN